jgi:hypothetical protein
MTVAKDHKTNHTIQTLFSALVRRPSAARLPVAKAAELREFAARWR